MTRTELAITVAAILIGGNIPRYLPFLLFSGSRTPDFVRYIGRFLPAAAMGLLVIYCFKGVSFTSGSRGLPELFASAATIASHVALRRSLVSIAVGTAVYIALIRFIFTV